MFRISQEGMQFQVHQGEAFLGEKNTLMEALAFVQGVDTVERGMRSDPHSVQLEMDSTVVAFDTANELLMAAYEEGQQFAHSKTRD